MFSSKFEKFFCVLLSVFVIFLAFSITGFCASSNYVTYSDVLQNNSTVQNLLTLRTDEQMRKNYICFRSSSDEYVLLISKNFDVNGKTVSCGDCDVICYNTSYGSHDSSRYYSRSFDNSSLTIDHVVVSDFLDGSSRVNNSSYNRAIIVFFVVVIALLSFWLIRRFK